MIHSPIRKIRTLFLLILLTNTQVYSMDYIKKRIEAAKQKVLDLQHEKLHKDFFAAAKNGDHTKLQGLVENPRIDVNARDADGNTALHLIIQGAAQEADHSLRFHLSPEPTQNIHNCIDLLVLHHGDVNAQDNTGNTPLHLAACQAPESILNNLIEKGACLKAVNNAKETVLHLAITSWNGSAVRQLIALGADPNQPSGMQGSPPLCIALKKHNATFQHHAYDGNFPLVVDRCVESLLKAGARINIDGLYDLKCETHPHILREVYGPLVAAIEDNNPTEVKRYFDQGASLCLDFEKVPNAELFIGEQLHNAQYPLNVATNCPNPHAEMVCFLMDAGCLGAVGYDILRNAFTHGNLEMAHLLISHMPKYNIIRSWNHVALPLLLYFKRLPQKLPTDVSKIICSYCVINACVAEQAENCRAFFRTEHFEFERLGSLEIQRNDAHEHAYTHILDNIPTWKKQIVHAILNRPTPKKNDPIIKEEKK